MRKTFTKKNYASDARTSSLKKLTAWVILLAHFATGCHKNAIVAGHHVAGSTSLQEQDETRQPSCTCCKDTTGVCKHKQKVEELQALLAQQNAKNAVKMGAPQSYNDTASTLDRTSCRKCSQPIETPQTEPEKLERPLSSLSSNTSLSMRTIDREDPGHIGKLQLQQQLEKLQTAHDALRSQLSHACPGLSACKTCIEGISQERRKMNQDLEKRLQDYHLLKLQHEQLKQDCKTFEDSAKSFQDKLCESEAAERSQQKQINDYKHRSDELQGTLDRVKKESDRVSNKYKETEKNCQKLETEKKSLEGTVEKLKKRIDVLQRSEAYKQEEAERVLEEKEKLEQELKDLKKAFQKDQKTAQNALSDYLTRANEKENELQGQIASLRARERELLLQTETEAKKRQEIEAEKESLQKAKDILLDRRRNSAEQHLLVAAAMQLQLDLANRSLQETRAEAQEKARRLADLENALKQQKDENDVLRSEAQEKARRLADLENALKQQKDENDVLRMEAQEKAKQLADLENALKRQKDENDVLRVEAQEKARRLADLENALKQQKDENDVLRMEAQEKAKQLADLENALKRQKDENDVLRVEAQGKEKKLAGKDEEIDKLRKSIARLELQLKKASPCNCKNHQCGCCIELKSKVIQLEGELGGQRSRNQTLTRQNSTVNRTARQYKNRSKSIYENLVEQKQENKKLKNEFKETSRKPKEDRSKPPAKKRKKQKPIIAELQYDGTIKLRSQGKEEASEKAIQEAISDLKMFIYTVKEDGNKGSVLGKDFFKKTNSSGYNLENKLSLQIKFPKETKAAITVRCERVDTKEVCAVRHKDGLATIDLGWPDEASLKNAYETASQNMERRRKVKGTQFGDCSASGFRNLNHTYNVQVRLRVKGEDHTVKLELPSSVGWAMKSSNGFVFWYEKKFGKPERNKKLKLGRNVSKTPVTRKRS